MPSAAVILYGSELSMLNKKCVKCLVKRFLSVLMLCGVLTMTACSPQSKEGAEIYNHIYKNGWMEMPPLSPGERPFSDRTRAALL